MTNEEKYIRAHIGTENPFRVPEGYFESLVPSLMEQLPATGDEPVKERKAPLIYRLRPILYAAACMLVAVFGVWAFLHDDAAGEMEVRQMTAQMGSDTYIEDVADYVMADNIDIYACLMNE